MAVNDPLGDMLTRIRNAQTRKRGKVTTPGSSLRQKVLDVLQAEGYIRGYTTTEYGNGRSRVRDRAQVLRQRAGDPQDRARLQAGPPRLRQRRLGAAGLQRPGRVDHLHAEGRDGRSRGARTSRRRRGSLHGLLTGRLFEPTRSASANLEALQCLVSARNPSPSPPASPPGSTANRSPSRAPRAS